MHIVDLRREQHVARRAYRAKCFTCWCDSGDTVCDFQQRVADVDTAAPFQPRFDTGHRLYVHVTSIGNVTIDLALIEVQIAIDGGAASFVVAYFEALYFPHRQVDVTGGDQVVERFDALRCTFHLRAAVSFAIRVLLFAPAHLSHVLAKARQTNRWLDLVIGLLPCGIALCPVVPLADSAAQLVCHDGYAPLTRFVLLYSVIRPVASRYTS